MHTLCATRFPIMCSFHHFLGLSVMCAILFVRCEAQNEVCLPIEDNPFVADPAFSDFDRSIHVLDCFYVLGESGISDAKLLHVASVVADLLDQDADGAADDLSLRDVLAAGEAVMPVLEYEGSDAEENLMEWYEGDGISAVLYNGEVNPFQTGVWGEDATVEEVLHTINHVGHVVLFPEAFSLEPNSSQLTEAMDVARGGQFLSLPNPYPEEAWYHYDDWTCDYECMAIEYLYWATVTEMGLLNDSETAEGIADEWELYSPELLADVDVLVHALITTPAYGIPLQAPDGQYCPTALAHAERPAQERRLIGALDLSGRAVDLERVRSGAYRLLLGQFSDGSRSLIQAGNK